LARGIRVLALLVAFTALCLILPSSTPAFQPPNVGNQLGQRPNPNAAWQAQKTQEQQIDAWWKRFKELQAKPKLTEAETAEYIRMLERQNYPYPGGWPYNEGSVPVPLTPLFQGTGAPMR
jgi:hypothetical protein